MNDPRIHDRLINQINRSAETLAACERTMRSAHVLLAAAHRQLERSRALQRHLDYLNRLHHPGTTRPGARELSDQR